MRAFVDGVDREGGRVMIDPHAPPSRVAGNVVDAIRNSSPEFGNDEVRARERLRANPSAAIHAGVLEVADEFFLLRVDGDCRLVRSERLFHPIIDGMELRVAIGMGRSLARLAIGLQAVIELVQEFTHQCAADLMAHAV